MSAAGGVRVTIDAGTGSPTFTNCTITANLGFRGGGMSFEASGTGTSSPTVIGCNVSGNTALTDSGPNPNNLESACEDDAEV